MAEAERDGGRVQQPFRRPAEVSAVDLSNSENSLWSAVDSRDSIAPANCDAVRSRSGKGARERQAHNGQRGQSQGLTLMYSAIDHTRTLQASDSPSTGSTRPQLFFLLGKAPRT